MYLFCHKLGAGGKHRVPGQHQANDDARIGYPVGMGIMGDRGYDTTNMGIMCNVGKTIINHL